MQYLRKGSKGPLVEAWGYFLTGLGYEVGEVDDRFGPKYHEATKKWQQANQLNNDGVVGNLSFGVAMQQGFSLLEDKSTEREGINWPPKPRFRPLSSSARKKLFGDFQYKHTPRAKDKDVVTIKGDWAKENIMLVEVPQLAKATNGKYTKMRFNKKAVPQLLAMFREWERAGLLHLIKTYAGAFYPRFIRGSKTNLSNHSWGTALDINVAWNGLGRTPALVGREGSVRELVKIANKHGFYWGGHFSRKDGMHFEVYKIVK